MKYSEMIFGNSELALRLPNIIAFVLLMLYVYKVFRRYDPLLSASIFIIIITNIPLVAMFGLARGYGLSCAFMVVSLYHYLGFIRRSNKVDLVGFHLAALLAVLSHFTLLTYYVTTLVLLFPAKVFVYKTQRSTISTFRDIIKPQLLPLLINGAILYEPLRRAFLYGQLDVGGKSGFFADTVKSFVYYLTNYSVNYGTLSVVLQIIIVTIVVAPLIVFTIDMIRTNGYLLHNHMELVLSGLIIFIISIIIVSNHYILGADFPIGRFSIFLIPLFWIHTGFLINVFLNSSLKKYVYIITLFLVISSAVDFFVRIDMKYYREWKYDSQTNDMIDDLISYHDIHGKSGSNIKIGNDWFFEPTINFYRQIKGLNWILPANRNGVNVDDDFQYILKSNFNDTTNFMIFKEYGYSESVLVKNKSLP